MSVRARTFGERRVYDTLCKPSRHQRVVLRRLQFDTCYCNKPNVQSRLTFCTISVFILECLFPGSKDIVVLHLTMVLAKMLLMMLWLWVMSLQRALVNGICGTGRSQGPQITFQLL